MVNHTPNDFLGLTINGMNMQFNTEAHHPSAGTVNTSQNVNINNGPHQSVVVGADVTLNLTAWTTTNDKTNKVRIYVKTADTTRTITFSSNNGSGTIKTSTNWPQIMLQQALHLKIMLKIQIGFLFLNFLVLIKVLLFGQIILDNTINATSFC